jgi:hypothetical protein
MNVKSFLSILKLLVYTSSSSVSFNIVEREDFLNTPFLTPRACTNAPTHTPTERMTKYTDNELVSTVRSCVLARDFEFSALDKFTTERAPSEEILIEINDIVQAGKKMEHVLTGNIDILELWLSLMWAKRSWLDAKHTNRCCVCRVDLGFNNPRQLCGKTSCNNF